MNPDRASAAASDGGAGAADAAVLDAPTIAGVVSSRSHLRSSRKRASSCGKAGPGNFSAAASTNACTTIPATQNSISAMCSALTSRYPIAHALPAGAAARPSDRAIT